MKRNLLALLGVAALLGVSFGGEKSNIYTGEIMDSRCAQLGSHAQMEKSNHTKSQHACSLACVEDGASFVLVEQDARAVHKLDDQKKAKNFAGLMVNVTGTLDEATSTIHVKRIDRAPGVSNPGW